MNIHILLKRIFQIPKMYFSLFKKNKIYKYIYFSNNKLFLGRYNHIEQICLFENYNFSSNKILIEIHDKRNFFEGLNDLYKILYERAYL